MSLLSVSLSKGIILIVVSDCVATGALTAGVVVDLAADVSVGLEFFSNF